jgi:hypothetical protein
LENFARQFESLRFYAIALFVAQPQYSLWLKFTIRSAAWRWMQSPPQAAPAGRATMLGRISMILRISPDGDSRAPRVRAAVPGLLFTLFP